MYTQWIIHLIHKWSIERFKDGCCLSISVSTKLFTCHWRLHPTISIRSHSTCKTDTYMHRNIKMYRLINGYHWSTYITLQSRNTSMFPLFMVHGDEYRKYDDSLNYTSIAGFIHTRLKHLSSGDRHNRKYMYQHFKCLPVIHFILYKWRHCAVQPS